MIRLRRFLNLHRYHVLITLISDFVAARYGRLPLLALWRLVSFESKQPQASSGAIGGRRRCRPRRHRRRRRSKQVVVINSCTPGNSGERPL